MTTTLGYNLAGQLLGETNAGGTLGNLAVTNGYDLLLRRTNLSVLNLPGTILTGTTYGYDAVSRMQTVSDGTNNATYSYIANSPLVSQIVFKTNSTTRMTTTKSYDYLNRLTSISSAFGSSAIGYSYVYNNANQRVRATLADGSYWLYEYDPLGQVRSGRKYWSDGKPVAGQQFEYAFDDIGNRTSTKAGGDENGANLRAASYSANPLNQYDSRTVAGAVDVMGIALGTNPVTVNTLATYRKGEYFRKELWVNNNSAPVWQSVSVAANGEPTVTGNAFVIKTNETFVHDLDGNLTSDGRWNYTWDAENRLIRMSANNPAVGPQQCLAFEYDWESRRIAKKVWPNAGGTGDPTNSLRFLYDGWNLLTTLDSTRSPLTTFTWGLDLSGTLQGAGGIGGLLFVGNCSTPNGSHLPAFDGNGNVAALVYATAATNPTTYEYGPFGEVLRATGPMAKANPFRFSTKYQDDETDLLYYGYRYYNASTGKWITRDPKEEVGGLNLYGFLRNAPISEVDRLGLSSVDGDSCTCGPEVTYQLRSVLLNAQMTFVRTWPENAKLHACTALVDYLNPASMKAWEIEPLYTWGAVDMKVAFNRKCYYASAVNYALWGTACRLCYDAAIEYSWMDNTGAFLAPMWTHKRALFWARFWKHTLLKDYSDRADQAFSFTTYGYTGRLNHSGIPGMSWDGRYQRTPFDWFWSPNKPK